MQNPTPQQLMQQFAQKVARTRAYSYTWEFQERDEKSGKLGDKQIYKLEFLQPHYRKMTIIQRDLFSNGAVLIYNPDVEKKVHARKGLIRRVYELDDPEIARFFETDLGSILKDLQRLFRGAKAEAVKREKMGQREGYTLRFAPPKDAVQQVSLTLEVRDLMPLRIEYADSKGTRSLRVFTEYAFPNLKPDDFKF
jgi:outer membrane lipoprotein-sorting protein